MEPFIGMIIQFGGNFAPRGWAFCDGQLLPIAENSALFSILGTSYGGDGVTSFGLPDLRGRAAVHPGNGPGLSHYRLGDKGGAEQVTLTVNQMPSHKHGYRAIAGDSKSTTAAGNALGNSAPGNEIYSGGTPDSAMNEGVIANTGGGQPVQIIQPFQCVNFIIALVGIYPSRS
ncbi:Phage Tail Collar Domain protein [Enhygromyxa salina]|uniref:Phage Tail Collar Domain protein n=1 Tax=Enhygromyxa salina TaxID=215803 RepID=A0A2S9YGN7_9BACT|nr:tail fiber protein [Enhygromyxa salina]PRQ04201.1 Phage Tail Collar Domain protein [Enhygromyxa salina]